MPDKKPTDNKIKKALECCINDDCDNCPDTFGNCEHNAMRNALNLINRQEVEVEAWKHYYNECLTDLKNAHAEIEKIKKDLKYYLDTNEENGVVYVPKFILDKILNEVGNA